MSDGLIYYFGDDKVFFNGLKARLDNFPLKIQFESKFATQEILIQSLFLQVIEHQPDAVLIDFSLYADDYLHLARMLSRTPMEKDIKIIGVFDHLIIDKSIVEAQSTGISLCFIKSDHIRDISNTLERLVYPTRATSPGYVKTKLLEIWRAGLVSKVGYLTESGLHIETNLKLSEDERVSIEHFWRNKILIPSKEVTIKKVSDENLVYNFNYAVDAEFEFMDLLETNQTPEEEVKKFQLIEEIKYRFKKIFLKNIGNSREKIAKVLIIDSTFSIYQGKRSDRFPYMLRCLGSKTDLTHQLNRFNPQIIVISLNDEITEEAVTILKNWCTEKSVHPYWIFFNSQHAVSYWQAHYDYQYILASSEEINTDVLLKMAKAFATRLSKLKKMDDKKIFISKTKEESNCLIELQLEVTQLSESEIVFTSTRQLPLKSNLVLSEPIKALIYVIEETEEEGKYRYEGILHSIGALEKNSIRRYINAALFKENNPDEELPLV